MKYFWEAYEDQKGKWRWRLKCTNGHIIADSGQGYASKKNVMRAIKSIRIAVEIAEIRETVLKIRRTL